jgi:hypothetical protein
VSSGCRFPGRSPWSVAQLDLLLDAATLQYDPVGFDRADRPTIDFVSLLETL